MITPSERHALTQFLNQLKAAPAPQKVVEADTLIREAIGLQPDAAYLLVQRAILLEQALNSAKAQIAALQNRLPAAQTENSFLGNNPWAQPSNTASDPGAVPGAGQYQIPRNQQAFGGAQPNTGGGSGFLGNIATTAAGVVAGSFLFQGIENLLGHHSGSWLPSGNGYQEHADANTIINNYYESPPNDAWAQGNDDSGFLASDSGFLASDDGFAQDDGNDTDWV